MVSEVHGARCKAEPALGLPATPQYVYMEAYIDESGDHRDSAFLVVAGYVSSPASWRKFEAAWNAALAGGPEFHASKFFSRAPGGARVGPYRGWSNARADAFLDGLLQVVEESDVGPVAAALDLGSWRALSLGERQYLTGAMLGPDAGRVVRPGAPKKPYFVPFLLAVRDAAELCGKHRVDLKFDLNNFYRGYAAEYFARIKGFPLPWVGSLGEIGFLPSQDAPGLQAADLLAYSTLRYLRRGEGAVDSDPILSRALRGLSARVRPRILNSAGIDQLLAGFRCRPPGASAITSGPPA